MKNLLLTGFIAGILISLISLMYLVPPVDFDTFLVFMPPGAFITYWCWTNYQKGKKVS